ncbi:hypothetical protein J8273_4722 [Carpediemonas membranifera]|uniref:Uncharacterized protein n=1 Tax=Carpediemonas membranifera TaxID=201153 RepID=A0A8J6B416_9EUKA|nr:hypothetical protein J8273_4722 [Carpediemonas membranifera]|eukprot:KAG9393859.1 hypothetical protein J8273_4722 [Carpediemonas membranifera]
MAEEQQRLYKDISSFLAGIEREPSSVRCLKTIRFMQNRLEEEKITDVSRIADYVATAFNSGRISSQSLLVRALFIAGCCDLPYLSSLQAFDIERMVNDATSLLSRRDTFITAYSAGLLSRLALLLPPDSTLYHQQIEILLSNLTLVLRNQLKHRGTFLPLLVTAVSSKDILVSVATVRTVGEPHIGLLRAILSVIPSAEEGPERATLINVVAGAVSDAILSLGDSLASGEIEDLVAIYGDVFLILRSYQTGTLPDAATAIIIRAAVEGAMCGALGRIPNYMSEFISFCANVALHSTGLLSSAALQSLADILRQPGFVQPPMSESLVLAIFGDVRQGSGTAEFCSLLARAFDSYLSSHGLLGSGMVAPIRFD